jgi:NitT/TauT family transport system substrate-binding protein
MSKPACILLIALVLSLSACVAQPPAPSPAPSTPVPQPTAAARTGTLRVSAPTTPGPENIPFWIALDTLRQQGYVVEATQYARYDLVTAGLISGELDIALSSHQPAWAAIAKGAAIKAIVARVGNPWIIGAKVEVKACADLQGKIMAYPSTVSLAGAMSDRFLERTCPGTQPEIVLIPTSENRLAALLSGEIDATILQVWDMPQLERDAPGKFHALRYLVEDFPLVDNDAYYVGKDFAAKHPDIVKDFVRALVQADRRVQDPQILREAIRRYLPDDANALEDADAYLALKTWDVNGGLTPERIQFTLSFLTDVEAVPPGVQVEQLADLSYLNAVLNEIGRQ